MANANSNPLAALEKPANADKAALAWPPDLGIYGKYISFTAHKYKKPNRATDSFGDPNASGKIRLPLPANLSSNYSQSYDNASLGAVGSTVSNYLGSGATDEMTASIARIMGASSAKDAITSITQLAKTDVSKFLGAAANIGGAMILDRFLSRNDPSEGGFIGAVAANIGVARNPNMAMLYNSPEFRSFSFEYKMIAKSYDESLDIIHICNAFKKLSAPTRFTIAGNTSVGDNLLFNYPHMWELQFSKDVIDSLFKFAPCVLKSVGINYHSEGSAQYFNFNGKRLPASVTLTLEFQELVALLSEDHESGF